MSDDVPSNDPPNRLSNDPPNRLSNDPPNRLSNDPRSPHFNEAILRRGIGIRFKGVERTNVEEYCVSEGWVRVAVGRTLDRRGNPMTMKLNGAVEPYFRDLEPEQGG